MRTRPLGRLGKGVWGSALVSLLVLSGCSEGFFVDAPDPSGTVLEIRIVGDGAEMGTAIRAAPRSAARAFERVDRVAVRVAGGGDVLVDEVVQASRRDGEIHLEFSFDLRNPSLEADLEVTLRTLDSSLFEGEGRVLLRRGRTARAQLPLHPVPGGLALPSDPGALEALGDTLVLGGAVVFATGDTIPGLTVEWASLTPDILTVSPTGTAVAIAEGEAQLRASFGDFARSLFLRVAPVVTEVQVGPSEVQLEPGESVQLTPEARDRRGNPLPGREVTWGSSDPTVAQVDSVGRVRGIRPGAVEIRAEVEGVGGVAQVTVIAVVPVVQTLSVEEVEANQALLVARVDPRGVPADLVFRWGTDPQLSDSRITSPIQIPAGFELQRFERSLGGLDPETTYYVRAEATNEGGRATGSIQQFTTLPLLRAPQGLSAAVVRNGVALDWSFPFPELEGVEFQVERGLVEGPGSSEPERWTRIGTTSETRFLDSRAPVSSTLSYRVRACQGSACSPYSASATVTTPDLEPAVIQGVVTLNGNSVESMVIQLTGPEGTRTTSTATDGSYSFQVEPPGDYQVEAVPSSVEHPNGWYRQRIREVQVSGGEVIQVDFPGFITTVGAPGRPEPDPS